MQHDCKHFFGKDDMLFSCGGDRLRLFEKEVDRKKKGREKGIIYSFGFSLILLLAHFPLGDLLNEAMNLSALSLFL